MCEKFTGTDRTRIIEGAFLFWGKHLSSKVSKRDFLKNCKWEKDGNEVYFIYLCEDKNKKWKHKLKKRFKNNMWKEFIHSILRIKRFFVNLFIINRCRK